MFTNPLKNLKALGLREDAIVADLGAGTGFYSIAAGTLVPQGKVYAIEMMKDYVTTIKNKALDAHLSNVDCFLGDIEKVGGTHIGDKIVDAAIASNILSHVEKKDEFIQETKRILKTNGRLLLIDVDSSVLKSKNTISKSRARAKFEQNGFVWQRDIDAGEHHYGMILVKA